MFQATLTRVPRRPAIGRRMLGAQPDNVPCAPGTTWSDETGACECPVGMLWDPVTEQCTALESGPVTSTVNLPPGPANVPTPGTFEPFDPNAPFDPVAHAGTATSPPILPTGTFPTSPATTTSPTVPVIPAVDTAIIPKVPFYKNPLFWVGVGGGVVVLGTGALIFGRRGA